MAEKTVTRIDELTPDPDNVRKHGVRNQQAVAESLKAFGPARSIVIDKDNRVLAGNATVDAAKEAGVTKVRVVKPKKDEIIAVQRDDWDEDEAKAYAIADNQTAALATWDFEKLAGQLRELVDSNKVDVHLTGFNDNELEPLLTANWVPPNIEDMPGRMHAVHFTPEQWKVVEHAINEAGGADANPAAALTTICQEMVKQLPEPEQTEEAA